MRIGVIGMNATQLPIETREEIARLCARQFASRRIVHPTIDYVLLLTCHRIEIYFYHDADAHSYLLSILRQGLGDRAFLEQRVYSLFGLDCFHHLVRVTAGLDSTLMGETEIQGQVKRAYQHAHAERALSSELHFLFQKSLKIAKGLRTSREWTPCATSLAHHVETYILRHRERIEHCRFLLVGASAVNQRIASHFTRKKISLTYCNRTLEKVRALPYPYLPWEERERWGEFDIVIVATQAPTYLLTGPQKPPQRSSLLFDLSVPRNIDPEVGNSPGITLINIDQLLQHIPRPSPFIDDAFITHAIRKHSMRFVSCAQNACALHVTSSL